MQLGVHLPQVGPNGRSIDVAIERMERFARESRPPLEADARRG